MILEIVTLAGTLFTAIVVIVNSIVLHKLNKGMKTFDVSVEELHELNRKLHDRLVDAEDEMKSGTHLSEKTRKGLRHNVSRLMKYDDTIINDVNFIIDNWDVMLSLKERGNISDGELSKTRSELIILVGKIKLKIDKLQIKT